MNRWHGSKVTHDTAAEEGDGLAWLVLACVLGLTAFVLLAGVLGVMPGGGGS